MRSPKSRSRSKNNRSRTLGNVANRVFDSSGPEGKVRGTPQQIIDKYNQLARDAQLSNDRVAAENFQQHAEHYLRLLAEVQKENELRREQAEKQRLAQAEQRQAEAPTAELESEQPDVPAEADTGVGLETPIEGDEAQAELVVTPEENAPEPEPVEASELTPPSPRKRAPRARKETATRSPRNTGTRGRGRKAAADGDDTGDAPIEQSQQPG